MRTLEISEDLSDYAPILKAISFINEYWNESDLAYYSNIPPITGVVSPSWYNMTVTIEKDQLRTAGDHQCNRDWNGPQHA